MSRSLSLVCLLMSLFLGVALAAGSCLSQPARLSKGQACGGSIECNRDTFCNKEGVCEALAKEGEDCKDAECELPLACKGPVDYRRCYAPVHPGQDCTDADDESGPRCGIGFGSCISSRCLGGSLGDACYEDDDCLGALTCPAGICTGLAVGKDCDDSSECVVGAYCDTTCKILPSSGACDFNVGCAYGFTCQKVAADDDVNPPQCFAKRSLAAGLYCLVGDVCESQLCLNNACAAKGPSVCIPGASECADDYDCTCEGKAPSLSGLQFFLGSCKKNPCFKITETFFDCFNSQCKGSANYFNGSCAQINCEKEILRYIKCSPASTLLTSLFSVAFFALLSSFFSRHF